jgi:multidrug efflux pump subunit AcrA (membrane-fusion protein)
MPIETPQVSFQSKIGDHAEPKAPKNPWIRVIIYLIVIGILGFVAWRIYQNHVQAAAASVKQAQSLMSRPVPVQVTPVMQQPMPIYLTGLGTVTPYMTVTVKARVSGQLLPVKFTEGQEVRQGETIMNIDPAPYQAALDQAKGTLAHDEALLKNAQAEYARYKALYAAGVVSKETMDADEASRDSMRAPSSQTMRRLRTRSCSWTGARFSRRSTAASACGWWTPATLLPRTRRIL